MKLLGMLLALIPVCGYGQAPADWKTLDHPAYSAKYPPNWELDERGEMGTKFFFFAPLESGGDKFRENVNLILQDLKGYNLTLAEYSRISEEQIVKMIANSKVLESKTVTTNSLPYRKLIYTGDQSNFKLQFEQYYWLTNDTAYILTFTAEQPSFEKFRHTAEAILNSFLIKK